MRYYLARQRCSHASRMGLTILCGSFLGWMWLSCVDLEDPLQSEPWNGETTTPVSATIEGEYHSDHRTDSPSSGTEESSPGDWSEGYPDGDCDLVSDGTHSTGPGGGEGTGDPIDVPAGQLTAGEWDDLDNWDFWLDLLEGEACQSAPPEGPDESGDSEGDPDPEDSVEVECTVWGEYVTHWGYQPIERLPVEVVDSDQPVIDAQVVLFDAQGDEIWAGRTDNLGRAELFSGMFEPTEGPFTVVVDSGESQSIATDLSPMGNVPVVVEIQGSNPEPSLDLMFVIDTTGSMSDELAYIQSELEDVIERVGETYWGDLRIRVSVNFYRDEGDEYVVRDFPFTEDIDAALDNLAAQSANGGGDWEEAVHTALYNAIEGHQWSDAATARLLFHVLDAPPHYQEEILETMHLVTREAATAGVQIIPLTGTGIDKHTEFLLRSIAISTNGTYTFLTDHSGIGGDHLDPDPTIPKVEIELANDMIVRIITERISTP